MSGSDQAGDVTHGFADKLRLILRVTGCETQKALYSKLKSINPDTGYDPVRAYKWTQGRASPRNHSVYDDLARLLELDVGGDVVRTCSYEAFCDLLAERYGDELPELVTPTQTEPKHNDQRAESIASPIPGYLVGRYLSISRAWSPHRPGCLILGMTIVSRSPDGGLSIDYVERLPGGDLTASGPVRRVGRNLIASLLDRDEEMALLVTYAMPPAPGIVLAGIMSGVTLHDAEMRPMAGRILSLRLPEGTVTLSEQSDSYLDLSAEEVAARLIHFGIEPDQASQLAPEILDFLVAAGDRGVIDAPISMVNMMIGKALR